MKYQLSLKSLLVITLLVLLSVSCQEDSVSEDVDSEDLDMIAATELANQYLSTNGRESAEKSITVVKFKDGQLLFGTNSDEENGYEPITEETITATLEPGEYIFWFSGGGLSDLDGIEFDEESQLQLVDDPEEIHSDKMWVLTIPNEIDEDQEFLKYDIVYQYKGNDGPPIRLDPKIKVSH